jgi:hypothetical protein
VTYTEGFARWQARMPRHHNETDYWLKRGKYRRRFIQRDTDRGADYGLFGNYVTDPFSTQAELNRW